MVLCRDCKHWKGECPEDYPRDRKPCDGYHSRECRELPLQMEVRIDGDARFEGIWTDANFGCVLGEQK
jgi:hypothetical protein